MTDPNAGTYNYTYDKLGNLTSQTDSNNQTVYYDYDVLGRIKKTDYQNNEKASPEYTGDVHYSYDDNGVNGTGLLTSVDDGNVKHNYAYDVYGNPTVISREIDGMKFIFTMDYDTSGRVTALTYPDGVRIERTYSDGEYLNSVIWGKDEEKWNVVTYGMYKFGKDANNQNTLLLNPENKDTVYRITGNGVETAIKFDPKKY